MKKDFLIITNKKSYAANNVFNQFKNDFNAELLYISQIRNFNPQGKSYKNIILCSGGYNPLCFDLLENNFKDSNLIQHDTTDSEDVQKFLPTRAPDLIFQRELTNNTKNIFENVSIEPIHFAIDSIYDEQYQMKDIDVSMMMTMTNQRRAPFVQHALELSKNKLSHLNWHIRVTRQSVHTPDEYRQVCNRSKVGLHYFGNSYDSIRIWELASTKTAIIMPELRLKSTMDSHMPFKNYEKINDDFTDLEEKIIYLLEQYRWRTLAQKSYNDYNLNHNPIKCYQKYCEVLKKHKII
jgi:hypothetical protein